MKKIIALLAAVCSLTLVNAQDQKTVSPETTPTQKPKGNRSEMMAMRHSKHLEKTLVLTAEQSSKVYEAMLVRFNDIQAIRQKAGENADKKALKEQVKPVREKFVQTMTGILTPEQKTKWEAHRKQVKKSEMQRTKGNAPPAAAGDVKKLTSDDDGIIDQ